MLFLYAVKEKMEEEKAGIGMILAIILLDLLTKSPMRIGNEIFPQ